MAYIFDHQWKQERERLANMEVLIDPFTIECLQAMGVSEGWRCLEVGAGGGSIAEWLCRRVGTTGKVVATDLETKFVAAIEARNLEVRRHDIRQDTLEDATYDLVHARKVLEHLPEPHAALVRMSAAVKPGGWLFVEDVDFASFLKLKARDTEFFTRAFGQIVQTMQQAGFQPYLGRELGQWLRGLGYEQVRVEGRTTAWTAHGTHPVPMLYLLTFAKHRERVVQQGRLTAAEVEQFMTDVQSTDFHALSSIGFAAWGRKPTATKD